MNDHIGTKKNNTYLYCTWPDTCSVDAGFDGDLVRVAVTVRVRAVVGQELADGGAATKLARDFQRCVLYVVLQVVVPPYIGIV